MKVYEIILLIAVALFLIWFETSPANGACVLSHCQDKATTRTSITTPNRVIIGDIYDPGTGRVQIRDTSRRIKFYIEKDGTITNFNRQKIGKLK